MRDLVYERALPFYEAVGVEPGALRTDHGSEFLSRWRDAWAYRNGWRLNFIPAARPIERACIEGFNGRLRDECLNTKIFLSIEDARRKDQCWRIDHDAACSRSALGNLAPIEFVGRSQRSRITGPTILKL